MGTYFPPLNLNLDADERAVKRAYAAALKQTRPEDDPAAFQALVAARDRALDWVRRRGAFMRLPDAPDFAAAGMEPVPPADGAGHESVTAIEALDASRQLETVDIAEPTEAPAVMIMSEPAPADGPPRPPLLTVASEAGTTDDRRHQPGPTTLHEFGFAAIVRAQQTSEHVLSRMALDLIRDEANGGQNREPSDRIAERWMALIGAADDLDLASRMSFERTIAIELDGVMQQASGESGLVERFAATILQLDGAFSWSLDPRRVVRLLGEPSGTHPLVFAIERFGLGAVRLRLTADGFPTIDKGDLAAWFGSAEHKSVKAYLRAQSAGRFRFAWSWYAFLSPPAWAIRTGLSPLGIGFAGAAITVVYVMFDPIANVGAANAFLAFLAVLTAARVAVALSAETLETAALVRVIQRIESGPLPPIAERRRLIAAGHGPKLLNVIVGLFFLLLVDGYWLPLVIQATNLREAIVGKMIVVPDRKTPGVTIADRLVAQSYIDHARQIALEFDELVQSDKADPTTPLRRRLIATLQKSFMATVESLPIGDYTEAFDRFRRDIARLKRRQ